MTTDNDLSWIPIAACSGVAMFGASFLLPTPTVIDFVLGIPMGLVTFGGVYLLRPFKVLSKQQLGIASEVNGDDAAARATIEKAVGMLRTIREAAMNVNAPNVRRRILGIANVGDEIVENLRRDTNNVKVVNLWINTYLGEFLNVVKRYGNLSRQGTESVEAQTSMAKMDETLDIIASSFDDVLKKLVNNDAMDLDVDMQVLRTMLKTEGV